MDISKEPRMFLMLALLFLGPGKRTTATYKTPDVKCIVFDNDYMTCEWDSSQKPVSNYSLYYRYAKKPMAECEHYLRNNEGINTGCWFNRSQINFQFSFTVYVNTSTNGSSLFNKNYTMHLQNKVKPNPPVNLTIQSLENNQLQVTWDSTYKPPHCLQHMVEYQSNGDTQSKNSSTGGLMKFVLPSVDPKKLYTFYVRSKISSSCGTTELWSLPAGPVFWGTNSTSEGTEDKGNMWFWIQYILFPIGSLSLLLLLFLTLMRVERVWLVLMPRIPNPSNKFEELFTAYQGNFSEWAGVPKDAVESFKPSYHESICRVTELLPGGGYLPLGSDILGKAGVSVDPISKTDIE